MPKKNQKGAKMALESQRRLKIDENRPKNDQERPKTSCLGQNVTLPVGDGLYRYKTGIERYPRTPFTTDIMVDHWEVMALAGEVRGPNPSLQAEQEREKV